MECMTEGKGNTYFILNGEIDEVGIHQNSIWRSQLSVVLEKERRRITRAKLHR